METIFGENGEAVNTDTESEQWDYANLLENNEHVINLYRDSNEAVPT